MTRVSYTAMPCKSALNRVRGMPFAWSLNPYRGCTHGCHYCCARATHSFYGMNANDDFATKIIVKTNLPEVLRAELTRPYWKRDRVAVGTATDAYLPCEGRYRLARRALEALVDFRTPVSVVTKSALVLRDAGLLADLHRAASATVYFTVTTLDPDVWRLVESGTSPPAKCLAAMERLVAAGVPCGIFLAPILPGMTDSATSIDAIAAAARSQGASSFGTSMLRLAPLVREHYLGFVAVAFPELLPRYERAHAGTSIRPDYLAAMEQRVAAIRAQRGFARDAMGDRPWKQDLVLPAVSTAERAREQLSLPL